jgi:hypothetical protein
MSSRWLLPRVMMMDLLDLLVPLMVALLVTAVVPPVVVL